MPTHLAAAEPQVSTGQCFMGYAAWLMKPSGEAETDEITANNEAGG